MSLPRVYLCGPINGCNDEECKDWRQQVKDNLTGWVTVDPMDRDFRGIEGDHTDEIVLGDKDDIQMVDVLLVVTDRPSWGTAMEILYAYERNITVVVVHPDGNISPWLRFHAHTITPDMDSALELLGGWFLGGGCGGA